MNEIDPANLEQLLLKKTNHDEVRTQMSKTQLRKEAKEKLESNLGPAWDQYMAEKNKAKATFDAIRIPAQEAYAKLLKEIEAEQ